MIFAVLIAGTRTYSDYFEFEKVVDKMLSGIIKDGYDIAIIQGKAKGADDFASKYALSHTYINIDVPANWDKFGKGAGFKRNAKMHEFLSYFEKRACLCFWDGYSKGTQHNFELCKTNNTPLKIYNYNLKKFVNAPID